MDHQISVTKEGFPSWRAEYQASDGKVSWDVDVESLACPVSVITPESLSVTRQFFNARRALKMGGALYGSDSSRWPARWFDAVTLLQHEIEREEAAGQKAINAYRARP